MSVTLEQAWAETQPGTFSEDWKAVPGVYEVTIAEAKSGTSKSGEVYLVVEFRRDSGEQWSDVRMLTKNGSPKEGAIKAAKVLLRQLGLDQNVGMAGLGATLGSIVGKRYTVEVKHSSQVSATTGEPFTNTDVIGVVTGGGPAPTQAAAQTEQPATDSIPWE